MSGLESSVELDVHEQWMRRALELAVQGQGLVEPNPMVGCVIVRDGICLGAGFHARFGGPHAEAEAIAEAGRIRGADVYVTLEPCCHQGKTPPCSQALIDAGAGRVIVAMRDPFPHVDGGGLEELRASGIPVVCGVLEGQARQLNAPYLRRLRDNRPWVIAKWAMSLDGKIATRSGDSQWISNESSRRETHRLRGRVDAILTGSGSVRSDDPLLTARPAGPRVAARIVLDSRASLPLDSQLVRTSSEAPVLVVCGPEADAKARAGLEKRGCRIWVGAADRSQRLHDLMAWLASEGMTNVLLECGEGVLGSFLAEQLIDETHVFVASKLIGGSDAPSPIGGLGCELLRDAVSIPFVECKLHDGDVQIISRAPAPS